MTENLIVVSQLPIIEEQMEAVKASIESRVAQALSLVCTEETISFVKKMRADLRAEYAELEERRKAVKKEVLAPYERFEAVYKECAGDIYTRADEQLKQRIASVEDELKKKKRDAVAAYFAEYRESLNIPDDLVCFENLRLNVTLSASEKSLRGQAKEFLDRIASDIELIGTQQHGDEIMAEFRKTLSASMAITTVARRHEAVAEELRRREAASAEKERRAAAEKVVNDIAREEAASAPVQAPVSVPSPVADEKVYSVSFRVIGTMEQLKAMKKFLNDGGYEYAQL